MRNQELKNFIIDSVHECFHLIEFNQIRDKCEFSKSLGACLGDRGQANCDDWNNGDVLF